MWKYFIFMLFGVFAADEYRTISTKFGSIRGKRVDSYGGHSGFAFTGIPMAKPPIGDLRFKTLKDPDRWNGVLDTFNYRNACLSDPVRTYKRNEGGPVSEDCMYINVFTTEKCLAKGGCAVMGVIHGGAIKFESPVGFRMDVIVNNFANEERNVVVVTIPYRLGTIGFFQLKEGVKSIADTNPGLRDIIFAFQWIRREIRSFGGDPKKVTAMGHSAGASVVNTLASLPSTVGLFSQIVVMSGPTRGGDGSIQTNTKNSQLISRLVGCASESETIDSYQTVQRVMECVRNVPEDQILAAQIKTYDMVESSGGPWIDGEGGVIPNYFRKLIETPRKLNVLIGTVTAEFRHTRYAVDSSGRPNLTRLHDVCEAVGYFRNYERPEKFTAACVDFYSRENRTQFCDDDYLFYHPTSETADRYAKAGGNVFVYSYDYWGAGEVFKKYSDSEYVGPSHSEDFIYIFGIHRNEAAMKPKDFEIERIYTGIVANFVNFGDPSSAEDKWEKWDKKKRNHFLIDFDKKFKMPGMRNGYYRDASVFWGNISEREGGDWIPLEDFPPKIDQYSGTDLFSAFTSHWLNISDIQDKTYTASVEYYQILMDHVKYLKEKRNLNVGTGETEVPEDTAGTSAFTINWLTLSLALAVVLLVGYILVIKFIEYRKRREYNEIPN